MTDPVVVIIPSRSDGDPIADGLRYLTQRIHEIGAADGSAGGLLGGEYGYGANFENDVFMVHRYCWCENEGCNWCSGDAPNFLYKPENVRISWYKYIGRSMESNLLAVTEWPGILAKCLESLTPHAQEAG